MLMKRFGEDRVQGSKFRNRLVLGIAMGVKGFRVQG